VLQRLSFCQHHLASIRDAKDVLWCRCPNSPAAAVLDMTVNASTSFRRGYLWTCGEPSWWGWSGRKTQDFLSRNRVGDQYGTVMLLQVMTVYEHLTCRLAGCIVQDPSQALFPTFDFELPSGHRLRCPLLQNSEEESHLCAQIRAAPKL